MSPPFSDWSRSITGLLAGLFIISATVIIWRTVREPRHDRVDEAHFRAVGSVMGEELVRHLGPGQAVLVVSPDFKKLRNSTGSSSARRSAPLWRKAASTCWPSRSSSWSTRRSRAG